MTSSPLFTASRYRLRWAFRMLIEAFFMNGL